MTDKELLAVIAEFIADRYQMTLSTYGEHPWPCILYYSFDGSKTLYFLSDPTTTHCQQIERNPQVAVSIADAPQTPTNEKQGFQAYGLATKLEQKGKIIHALSLWRKTLGVTSNAYTYAGMMKKAIQGRMYAIQLVKAKLFDESRWDEGSEPLVTF